MRSSVYFSGVILRASLAVGCTALVLGWSSSALAQSPTFQLDRLLPPGAPDDGIVLPRAVTQPDTIIFAQIGYGDAINPLRTKTVVNTKDDATIIKTHPSLITQQMSWYPVVGAEFLNRVIFSVAVPFYFTDGEYPNFGAGSPFSGQKITPVNTNKMGPGDTHIDLRAVAYRTPDERFAIGGQLGLVAPSGDTVNGLAGDGNANWTMGVMAEYAFKYCTVGATT